MSYRVTKHQGLAGARPALEPLLARCRPRTLPYLGWIYGHNPGGPATIWLASQGAQIVGALLALPRAFRLHGEPVTALNLCEIVVAPEHRRLGAAVKLSAAAWAEATEAYAFGFDHFVDNTSPVYQRLGWPHPAPVTHWMRRCPEVPPCPPAGDVSVASFAGPCDEELEQLDRRLAGREPLETVRSAEQLQWRLLDHLFVPHAMLVARRRGALIGYLAYRESYYPDDRSLTVVDALVEDDALLAEHLLPALLALAGARGGDGVWAEVVAKNPSAARWAALGFAPASAERTRRSFAETEHLVVGGDEAVAALFERGGWSLTAADQYPS